MLHLLKKDIILLKWRLIIYFFSSILCMVLLMIKWDSLGMIHIIGTAAFFCYIYATSLFEIEGKNSGDELLIALPYKRDEIVYTKFLSPLIWVGTYYIIAIIISVMISIGNHSTVSFLGIGIGILICSICISVITPVFVKYDYVKATNFSIMIVFAITVVFVLVIKYSSNLEWISKIVLHYRFFEDVILSIVGVMFLALSVFITKRIYRKKEF